MCGIAGFLNFSADLRDDKFYELGMRMAEKLSHRGPDARGICVERHAVLSVAQLKVVDIEGGIQPMQRERFLERYTICYNGEIYNTKEIKRELIREGVTFNTNSDTEVLLMAYITYGKSFVYLLNGIFAFAIWDEEKQELFLCRDRFGVKPLYYARINDFFIFASEVKALFEFPSIKPVIREEGLCEILNPSPFGMADANIFDNIFELKPATYKTISRFSETEKVYYKLHSYIHTDNSSDTADTIRYLLKDSILRESVADVPICTFSSGSPATNFILAVLNKNQTSSHFAHPFDADSSMPEEIISNLYLSAECLDFPDFSDNSAYMLGLYKKINYSVLLSGLGADEIFGTNSLLLNNVNTVNNNLSHILSPDLKNLPLEEYAKNKYERFISDAPEFHYRSAEDLWWREAEYLSIYWCLTARLTVLDRISMAGGLEVRVPYLDHRLISYVWNVPREMKIKDNKSVLLNEVIKSHLPEDIRNQNFEKENMQNPHYESLINEEFRNIISNPNSPILQLINKDNLPCNTKIISYLIKVNHWLSHLNISIIC